MILLAWHETTFVGLRQVVIDLKIIIWIHYVQKELIVVINKATLAGVLLFHKNSTHLVNLYINFFKYIKDVIFSAFF